MGPSEELVITGYGEGNCGVPLKIVPIEGRRPSVKRERFVGQVERRLRREYVVGLIGPEGSGRRTVGLSIVTGDSIFDGAWSLSLGTIDGDEVPGAISAALELVAAQGLAHPFLLISDVPLVDEMSAHETVSVLSGNPGVHVLLCLGWEAEPLAEALGDAMVSVHDGPVVDRSSIAEWLTGTSWNSSRAMEMTAGIASLIVRLDADGTCGPGHGRELSRLLLRTVLGTPLAEDRCVRALIVLLGEGCLHDLQCILGPALGPARVREHFMDAGRQEPLLGIRGAGFARVGGATAAREVLDWAMDQDRDLVAGAVSTLAATERWDQIASMLSHRTDLPLTDGAWAGVGELVDHGEFDHLRDGRDHGAPWEVQAYLDSLGLLLRAATTPAEEGMLLARARIGADRELVAWARALGLMEPGPLSLLDGDRDLAWRLTLHGALLGLPGNPVVRELLAQELACPRPETISGALLVLAGEHLGLGTRSVQRARETLSAAGLLEVGDRLHGKLAGGRGGAVAPRGDGPGTDRRQSTIPGRETTGDLETSPGLWAAPRAVGPTQPTLWNEADMAGGSGGGDIEPLRIRALGPLALWLGEKALPVQELTRRSAANLLGLLAFTHGHELPRERVLSLMWPDVETDLAKDRLYAAMTVLRKVLGGKPRADTYLTARNGTIGLVAANLRCDVDEADGLCRLILSRHLDDGRCAKAACELMGLFDGGDVVAGSSIEEEFVARRHHMLCRCLDALVMGAEAALSMGDVKRSCALARECFRADRSREDVCDVLLRALVADGRYPEAERVFTAHAEAYMRIADLPPTRRIRALYRSITRLRNPGSGPSADPIPSQDLVIIKVPDGGEAPRGSMGPVVP